MVQFKCIALATLLGTSAAFAPNAHVSPSFACKPPPRVAFSQETGLQRRNRDTSLNVIEAASDAIITTLIFGAAVALTILRSEKADLDATAVEEIEVEAIEEAVEEEVEAIEEAVEEKVEEIEEAVEEEVVEEEEEEVVAVEEVIPEPPPPPPAPKPAPAPAPVVEAGKSIGELRKQVSSTVDTEKAKQDRLKAAQAKKEAEAKPAEPEPEAETEEAKEDDDETKPKRFSKVKRVLKKVVMPWKKWSDIS